MTQHCRKSHPNIQGPFHWSLEWMCKVNANASVVSTTAAGGTPTATTSSIGGQPRMSAYAHLYQSQHDYNKHPFVPIGMEALVHKKPHKRRSFAQHCKKGYVRGTSFEHYQCQTVSMVDLHNRRTSGAIWFKHKYLTHPSVTPVDRITEAIGGLAKTLTTVIPPPTT